jgi:hypothetical protein
MSKTSIGFVVAAVFIAGGVALTLGAPSLATEWHGLASTSRPTPADLARQSAYHDIGLTVLAFGFVLAALTFHRWLSERASWHP